MRSVIPIMRKLLPIFVAAVAASYGFTEPTAFSQTDPCAPALTAGVDNRVAIQNAINACPVLHLPKGSFFVSQGAGFFDLNLPAGHSLVGAGRGLTTLMQTAGQGASVRLLEMTGDGTAVSDLTLDGNKANQTVDEHRSGVFATGAPNVKIERVNAQNFTGDGFYVFNGSNDATVDDVMATANDRNGITFGGGTTGGSVTSSVFRGNGVQQLDSEPGTGATVDDLLVTNSTFDPAGASNDYALTMSGSSTANSTGWTVTHNTINGGVFAVWLDNSEIANNRVTNATTKPCITVYRQSSNIQVAGNVCTQTQTAVDSLAGVLVQGTGPGGMPSNITVSGNTVNVSGRAASFGVRAEGVVSVTISKNILNGPGESAPGHAGVYVRSTIVGSDLVSAIVDQNTISNFSDAALRLAGNTTSEGSAVIRKLEFENNTLGDTTTPVTQVHAVTIDSNAVPQTQTRTGNTCTGNMSCTGANL